MKERTPVAVRLIELRFLVGALGERLGWWPSRFTDEIGLRRLAIPFPRTALRAALESVNVAARRDHDERLNPATVHLFRLGTALEDAIRHHLTQGAGLSPPPSDKEKILAALDAFCAPDGSQAPVGPCSLGREQRTRLHSGVNDMARVYAQAGRATGRERAIPYFEVA
jgi:hypothetical protein